MSFRKEVRIVPSLLYYYYSYKHLYGVSRGAVQRYCERRIRAVFYYYCMVVEQNKIPADMCFLWKRSGIFIPFVNYVMCIIIETDRLKESQSIMC